MKRKFVFLLIFIILIIGVFTTSSQAVTIVGKEFPDFPDDYNSYEYKYIFYRTYSNGNGYYILYLCPQPMYVARVDVYDDYYHFYIRIPSFVSYKWEITEEGSTWESYSSRDSSSSTYVYFDKELNYTAESQQLIYASEGIEFNITSSSGDMDTNEIVEVWGDDYFFHQAPLTISVVMQWSIGATTWQTAARVIAVVMIVIVGLIALRKGLALLLNFLRKS